ncbi:MAG: glutamate 5-kinase [Spirochaetes bacterium]|nr:glutamate 5-kinase [Spirochaetota bacterium]
MPRKQYLKNVKRIVVKIGSSSLTEKNILSPEKMSRLADEIAAVWSRGYEVILVSSGAISAGAGILNVSRNNLSIPQRQALAAVGQTALMHEYQKVFSRHKINIAQVLMTEDDVKNRKRYLNIRNTFNQLLSMKIIPIVNENDTVVVTEIKFGDNDTLSAHVSNIAESELLILLSDIDGFYNDLDDAEPVDIIEKIDSELVKKAGGTGSAHGTGGMVTKIAAANMIMNCGQQMIIASANEPDILVKILNGEKKGTIFLKTKEKVSARKRWILYNVKTSGKIFVDSGAIKALISGKKSLLAIGITGTEGKFTAGDAVEICGPDNVTAAKGITNYSSKELMLIKGKKSNEIDLLFGEHYYDEVIHRDNLSIYS